MAKSKSGGTRSYIRGKIGADVYSVGRDGKGKRQQVVRSLAEQVANPQTEAQMFGRMVMSTVMQAVSALKPIIDHSFDGIPAGQPSISEFIRRNYALVKADAEAHPASGNSFGLNKYQEKGIKAGTYIISKGNVAIPAGITVADDAASFTVDLPENDKTVGALKAAMGLGDGDDYFTLIAISGSSDLSKRCQYCRFRVNPALADTTVISSSNVGSVFVTEGNVSEYVLFSDGDVVASLDLQVSAKGQGFIVSRKNADGWAHSTSVITVDAVSQEFAANVALTTYPQGSARFLNGGDI